MTIPQHRTADATLSVLDPSGKPLPNQTVTVTQSNHQFLFGCTGFNVIALANDELSGEAKEKAQRHDQLLRELCNFITLPFYWGRFEPERGKPDTKRVLTAAKYFAERGCVVKGHPLCWHTVTAPWLMEMSNDEIVAAQRDRIQRDVKDFAGVIDAWDVINEVVIMPIFDKYDNGITRICRDVLGRIGIVRMTFDAARRANPRATLLLNDFDMSAAYECLIEGCLEAGIKIDALGLQSHMHQGWWGVEKTMNVLERFARYKLPLHFTETTLVSGKLMPPEIVDLNDYQVNEWPSTPDGEARQAEEVSTHYKMLFAHPAVQAITWWGLGDGGWLKAPSGLVRANQTPKPAYDALHKLIKEDWWTKPTKLTTDASGQVRFAGTLGDYTIGCAGTSSRFTLDSAGATGVSVCLP